MLSLELSILTLYWHIHQILCSKFTKSFLVHSHRWCCHPQPINWTTFFIRTISLNEEFKFKKQCPLASHGCLFGVSLTLVLNLIVFCWGQAFSCLWENQIIKNLQNFWVHVSRGQIDLWSYSSPIFQRNIYNFAKISFCALIP